VPAIVVTFVVGDRLGALGSRSPCLHRTATRRRHCERTLLPAAFVSSVFILLDDPSTLVKVVGSLLPLKPFALAFQDAVHATTFADSWSWGRLVVVALWGVAGMVLALRFFTWEPRQPRAARAGNN
jgi:ABC-2 type transport system permease protein